MSGKVKVKLKTDIWDGPKLLKKDSTIEVDLRTAREMTGNGTAEREDEASETEANPKEKKVTK